MGASFYLYSPRLKLKLYPETKSIIMHSVRGANRSITLFFGRCVNGKIKYTKFRHREDTNGRQKRGQISPQSIPPRPQAAIW